MWLYSYRSVLFFFSADHFELDAQISTPDTPGQVEGHGDGLGLRKVPVFRVPRNRVHGRHSLSKSTSEYKTTYYYYYYTVYMCTCVSRAPVRTNSIHATRTGSICLSIHVFIYNTNMFVRYTYMCTHTHNSRGSAYYESCVYVRARVCVVVIIRQSTMCTSV